MSTEDSASSGPRGRVLVTFARSWQALAAIRSLGRRGIEVIAADELSPTPGSLSKYCVDSFCYPNPEADPNGFLEALEDAVRRFAPEDGVPYVLLPVHRETYLIARHRERFEPLIATALPDADLIETVRDKGRLVELAAEHGVPTPRTWMPEDSTDVDGIADEVSYPAFVKVRRGVGGEGLEKVESPGDLRRAFDELCRGLAPEEARPIVQETAPGSDYCVSALLEDGEVRAMMSYRNLRTVVDGGPGALRRTVRAPEPEQATRRLLEGLGWHGIAEVDFMWTGEAGDRAYLIEINPRLFGGLFQAVASGVDYPWMLYRLSLGLEVEPPDEIDFEVITETPVVGLLATLREAVEDGARWEAIETSWASAKERFTEGAWRKGAEALWEGVKEGLDSKQREQVLEKLLTERESTVSQLLAEEDPYAALGLVYPLAIFLRRGKLTSGMMVGSEAVDEGPSGK